MKKIGMLLTFLVLFSSIPSLAILDGDKIKMLRDYTKIDTHLRDILRFQNIHYVIVDFKGEGLKDKSFRLIVNEIWNGEIKNTNTVINSSDFPVLNLQRITDNSFQIRVVSELTDENKLRMHFSFPRFTLIREYDAIESEYYSLRPTLIQPERIINPGEEYFVLTYMLPYEEDGFKHYCSVEVSGSDILSWGEEFGIEHYLVFQIAFEE